MSRIHVPIAIRFSDIDSFGHVNNAAILTLLEEARIAVLWGRGDLRVDGVSAADSPVIDASTATTVTLVGRQEIEYLAPIPYLREPLDVQLWLARLGGASLEVCYEVCSPEGLQPPVVYARAATTLVLVDPGTGRPRRITDRERAAWSAHLDDPVVFAKRP